MSIGNQDYKEAVARVKPYAEPKNQNLIGFCEVVGQATKEKAVIAQNNLIIELLIQLSRRVSDCQSRLQKLEDRGQTSKDCTENLGKVITTLNSVKSQVGTKGKEKVYSDWVFESEIEEVKKKIEGLSLSD